MKSILSFKHYDILETIYRYNPSNELESEDVIPKISLKISYKNKERRKAVLIFSMELGDKKLIENSFYAKAVIAGLFTLEIGSEEENKDDIIDYMYKKNALAILYPYMRALISDLSSRGSENPIILPPINVGAMVDKNDLTIEEYNLVDNEE